MTNLTPDEVQLLVDERNTAWFRANGAHLAMIRAPQLCAGLRWDNPRIDWFRQAAGETSIEYAKRADCFNRALASDPESRS